MTSDGINKKGGDGSNSGMDLVLLGPEGKPRSFELYWREAAGPPFITLHPDTIKIHNNNALVWESSVREAFVTDRIQVVVSDKDFFGKVDIEALGEEGWRWITENAAIYKKGKNSQTKIRVLPERYRAFRFYFYGFDERYGEKSLPVEKIKIYGEKRVRNFAEETFAPDFTAQSHEGTTEITMLLPGSGIWIKELNVSTAAHFQGAWELGVETIDSGISRFSIIQHGRINTVPHSKNRIRIKIDAYWKSRSMILRLRSGSRYIGGIQRIRVHARLPRLVFLADKAGVYSIRTGTGGNVNIWQTSGDSQRTITAYVKFMGMKKNPAWRPESLVAKYGIRGGPINRDKYTWQADVPIPSPGYYRLVMNEFACREKKQASIRLVHRDVQIPFFDMQKEQKELFLDVVPRVDPVANRTRWAFKTPSNGIDWVSVQLRAKGIFSRDVLLEIPKPGNLGWQVWKRTKWINAQKKMTTLSINMRGFPSDRDEIRFTMEHGDNRPVEIIDARMIYMARVIHFIATESGNFELIGGHPDIGAPRYDLSLVQNHLLGIKPDTVEMIESVHAAKEVWPPVMKRIFSGSGWGLYMIFGIVTIVLLVIIVKIFPRVKDIGSVE